MSGQGKSCLLIDFIPVRTQGFAEMLCSQVLPGDDRCEGLSIAPIPEEERRSLAGQPDGRNLMAIGINSRKNLIQCPFCLLKNIERVLFYMGWLRSLNF